MPLEQLIEQQRARRIIENMVNSDRLPHALLFWGPAGAGKSVAAIELVKWLNCLKFPEGPCGTCESCVKFQVLEHPHFRYQMPLPRKLLANPEEGELTKAGAEELAEIFANKGHNPYYTAEIKGAQFILIGQIRSLLKWASVRAFSDKPRLALIDHADRLKEEAGNALLKLLEEPPQHFLLILTAETPEDILPTLRSRCHLIEFDRLGNQVVCEEIRKLGVEDASKAQEIANLSAGNLSRALQIANNPKDAADLHDFAVNIVRHSLGRNPIELNSLLEKWTALDSSEQLITLEIISTWLRDAAVLKELGENGENRIINNQHLILLRKFVANCPDADFVASTKLAEKARARMDGNALPQLTFLMLTRHLYREIYQKKPV